MTPAEQAAEIARRARLARREVLQRVEPSLRDTQLAVLRLALSRSWELREADAQGHVQPRGFAPGVSPNVSREWTESEMHRLVRLWNREMKGTPAVGVLMAKSKGTQ